MRVRYDDNGNGNYLLTMNKSKTAATINWTKNFVGKVKITSKTTTTNSIRYLLFSYVYEGRQWMNENKWINACTLFTILAIAHIDNVAKEHQKVKLPIYLTRTHSVSPHSPNNERREKAKKKKHRRKQISFAKVVGKKYISFHFNYLFTRDPFDEVAFFVPPHHIAQTIIQWQN